MPKPLLLQRPSGLFVRFLLPRDVRAFVGTRFVVRSLGALRGDAARLVAASMGYALARAFREVRGDTVSDKKKLINDALAAAARGDISPYSINLGPQGLSIIADGPDDHARAMEAIEKIGAFNPADFFPAPTPSQKTTPLLSASLQTFLEQYGEKNPAPATMHETNATLGLFRDVVGDKPMNEIGVEDVDAFRRALGVWPARARVRPDYKCLSTEDILKKAARERPEGIKPRTKDKHLDNLRKFFAWAVKRLEMTHNPLAGVRLQTKAQRAVLTRRGFTPTELSALFAPSLRAQHADEPSTFWLPVLALYTGARLREVAQLRVADVHEVAGVWGIDINYHAGPLKNAQSQRFVPLASAVLSLGFLDYLSDVRAAGFDRVFPDASWSAKNGPGDKVSKWFNRTYTDAAGLTDSALVFHSFRHTFADMGDEVGLTEAQVGALTGHQSDTVLGKHYIRAKTVMLRRQHVDRIAARLPLLHLSPYQLGQFSSVFTQLKKKQARTDAVAARVARQFHGKR